MITRKVVLLLTAFSLFMFLWESLDFFTRRGDKTTVYFFDVGQGDSIFIKAPGGQNILIDGGPDNEVLRQISQILPFWDRKIDLMILTHPHDDHVSGLIDVLRRYDVKKAVSTGVLHSSPSYLEWLKAVKEEGVPLQIIDKPQRVALGKDCWLDFVFPFGSLYGKEVKNLNNTSIVARLVFGESRFLFTGDIEEEIEKELVRSGADLEADVLKAAHHGSDTSNGEDFIGKVSPGTVVIQVGKGNRFGHPSGRVLKKLEKLGVLSQRTDRNGTVSFVSDGKVITRLEEDSLVNFKNIDIIFKAILNTIDYGQSQP